MLTRVSLYYSSWSRVCAQNARGSGFDFNVIRSQSPICKLQLVCITQSFRHLLIFSFIINYNIHINLTLFTNVYTRDRVSENDSIGAANLGLAVISRSGASGLFVFKVLMILENVISSFISYY